MPNYTSPLARSLGWDLHECSHEYDKFVKRQSHRIERQFARGELVRLEAQDLADAEAEATFAITLARVEEANAWMLAYCDEHEDAFDIAALHAEALELLALESEPDEYEALAWAEAGWGEQRFDPADVQWGFRVTDRP